MQTIPLPAPTCVVAAGKESLEGMDWQSWQPALPPGPGVCLCSPCFYPPQGNSPIPLTCHLLGLPHLLRSASPALSQALHL